MAKMTKRVIEAKITEYLALKEQIKELESTANAIKEALREEACKTDSKTLTAGEHSVNVVECSRQSINVKELTVAHPKIAAKFTKTTTYDTVKIK